MDTAWMIHNAMATEEASAYLYWSYFWPDKNQLVDIDNPWTVSAWSYPSGYIANDYFYAMQHFSRFVQPGFRRIAATTGLAELRATAYYNPGERRLVFVLINTSAADTLTPALAFPAYTPRSAVRSTEPDRPRTTSAGSATSVYRSTFSGTDERFAPLGALGADKVVTLPPQAVATIVVDYGILDCRSAHRCPE
jgi:O-glycosyl hydrolase